MCIVPIPLQGDLFVKQLGKRLTYANVMSSIAVFLVLGGATAFAAGQLGKNSVGTKQIKKGAVTEAKIKDGSVTTTKIADGSVITTKLADGSVITGKIVNAAVTSDKLADGSVVALKLGDGAVTTVKLLDAAVTTAKIANDAVTASKIAADAVGSSEIAPSVVGAEELDTVHEHIGPETEITDTTAHDGGYSIQSAEVSCGTGEDLLSVSVRWTATAGHNERNFVGATITRGEPDKATVEVNYDGGATIAKFEPVATCIF
jgi:hypothetical protein